MYYDKSLFNIYKEESLLIIYIIDYFWLKVLKKSMVFFNMLIDNKQKVVNVCNIFYFLKLKYNFLSNNIIKKANYLILAKKGRISVLNNKNNIVFKLFKLELATL